VIRGSHDDFVLNIRFGGWPDVFVNIQLLLHEDYLLELPDGEIVELQKGGRTFSPLAGNYMLTGPNGSRLTIGGVPSSEHKMYLGDPRVITGIAEQNCHRLILEPFTSVNLVLRLIPTP
jgi:hypothetical protein